MKPIYKPKFCKVIITLNVMHVHYVILSHLSFIIHLQVMHVPSNECIH